MAQIKPFAAVRYDESVVGELGKVVSPPYDIISPEDRVYYHKLHPNNFVRLVLGEELPGDDDSDNRFTRAGNYLRSWMADGAMKQDAAPALFVYQQIFQTDGCEKSVRGFTAAVKIQEYSDKVILPHENTLSRPKSELAVLIREVKANLDCVYGLYADAEYALDEVMDKAMATPPLEAAVDKDGVVNRLWAVTDPDEIAKVQSFISDKQIAIADGHHRYETALAYRNDMREKTGGAGEFDYVMMTLINVYEKDMTIYPTHRVLANLSAESLDNLVDKLEDSFEVRASSKDRLIEHMAKEGAIGMYHAGGAMLIVPREGIESQIEGSKASRELELNILHELILAKHLGIGEEKLRNQAHIIYTRDPAEAFKLVDSGQRQIAFFVNNIAVKSVLDIAAAGEKMPQKATYFYPKLLSGLVLRKLD
ncbi:MAG: DUF1015 domain-containing protein [Armatimonadetes bacterium]|jgi:uncharacterized protein (DUF1015 family)|nr:DUF1015 domain-containing protein [Armatimonadota bacterium]